MVEARGRRDKRDKVIIWEHNRWLGGDGWSSFYKHGTIIPILALSKIWKKYYIMVLI
jgi:hypothetical protein